MPITYYPDHATRALARVLAQYRDASAPGVKDVVAALAGEVQGVEDALWTILNALPRLGVVNLAPNPSFETDSDGDGLADSWSVYNWSGDPGVVASRVAGFFGSHAQRIAWTVANTGAKGVLGAVNGGWQPFKTYVLSATARGEGGALGSGMSWNWNTFPATAVDLLNPPLTASPQRYARLITWGAAVEVGGNLYLSVAGLGQTNAAVEIDGVLVTEGPTIYDFAQVGAVLDLVGKIVGEPRGGDVDVAYLPRIQARIRINRSSGSINDLISVFQALEPTATIKERGDYPAAFALQLQGADFSTKGASYAPLLRAARKAGVRSVLEFSSAPNASAFTFSGAGGLGFPDASNTPGSGGKLAGVKE